MAFTLVVSRWKSKLCVGNSSVVKIYIIRPKSWTRAQLSPFLFEHNVDIKGELSPLGEFMLFWRHENAHVKITWKDVRMSGVVYRTRTVFRILLGLQNIHYFYFERIIILFWRPRRRACRVIGLKVPNKIEEGRKLRNFNIIEIFIPQNAPIHSRSYFAGVWRDRYTMSSCQENKTKLLFRRRQPPWSFRNRFKNGLNSRD